MNSSVELAQQYIAKSLNAKKRNKEFSLSLIAFANIKSQTHCAYSGVEFDENNPMSLERVDNNVGYVDGNVIPVLTILNSVRGDLDFKNIDERIEFLSLKIATLFPKDENFTTSQKRLFDVKRQKKYSNLLTVNRFLKKKVKGCEDDLKKTNDRLLIQKLNKKQQKHFEDVVCSLETKINRMTKQIKANEKTLENIYLGAPIAPTNRVKNNKNFVDVSEIKRNEKLIERLKIVKQGLAKFQNLSETDKQKLKHGLPLSTSRYSLIKQKMSKSMMNVSL